MSVAALSSPSAFTSTLRTNSSPPTPTLVCFSTLLLKSPSTPDTSSRDTFARSAIALPSFCTAFASMWRRISAASLSPSVSSRIAARSTPERCGNAGAAAFFGAAGLAPSLPFAAGAAPFFAAVSAIVRHPGLHDLRDPLRILRDEATRLRDLLFVSEAWRFTGATRTHVHEGSRGAREQRRLLRLREQALGERLQHAEDDQQHDDDAAE